MEQIDRETESRVWERVLGEAPTQTPSEGSMLYLEAEAENAYRAMARRFPDRAEVFRRMAADARRHGEILRGICRMQDRECSPGQLPEAGMRETAASALRKCYHRALRLAEEYHRRENDREFGCAYTQMYDHQRAHLAQILELLGQRIVK